jgi:hypothetical protein
MIHLRILKKMSENKVRKKNWCCSVRADYVLEKLTDVSEPGLIEAEHYIRQFILLD